MSLLPWPDWTVEVPDTPSRGPRWRMRAQFLAADNVRAGGYELLNRVRTTAANMSAVYLPHSQPT